MAKKNASDSSKKSTSTPKTKKSQIKTVEQNNVDIKEKLSQGWIHINSMIEVMAVKKDVVESSLKQHLQRIEAQNGIIIVKKQFSSTQKVENPPKGAPQAFSQFVEIEILVRNYSMLVFYVFTFGPAAIEILAPTSITLGQGEAQDIANALASLIHQFASQSAGGVVISKKE